MAGYIRLGHAMCGGSQRSQPTASDQTSVSWVQVDPWKWKNVSKIYSTCQTSSSYFHNAAELQFPKLQSRYKKSASKTKQWLYRLPTIWLICWISCLSPSLMITWIKYFCHFSSTLLIFSVLRNMQHSCKCHGRHGSAPFKLVLSKTPSFIEVIWVHIS